MTVGSMAGRESVVCPACGEEVALNGSRQPAKPLSFKVKKVDDAPPRPMKVDVPEPAPKPKSPPPIPPDIDDAVEQAVAAYTGGKTVTEPGTKNGRRINPRNIVPIGIAMILLGGTAAIVGSIVAANGMKKTMTSGGYGGEIGGDAVTAQTAAYAKLIRQLAQEPNAPVAEPPKNDLPKAPTPTPKDNRTSGQGMLIGGMIAGGVGSLLTFIGGIFLLAGLIGRFIEKPQT